jgi:hypothetical protein
MLDDDEVDDEVAVVVDDVDAIDDEMDDTDEELEKMLPLVEVDEDDDTRLDVDEDD